MPTDYSTRIAGQFLEDRARLGAALHSLSALISENIATLPLVDSLQAVQSQLRRPFVFLTVGEASAEKSSLLHALFGREFSDPSERLTSIFRYSEHPCDFSLADGVVEHGLPLPFLRDFQLVETECEPAPAAPTADLIIFVLSARDPWNDNAWESFDAVRENHGDEVIIAVQHADERSEMEIEAICRHVARTAQGRFGEKSPVFAVSARKALLARTSGLDRDRLWRESGFAPLEACIDQIVSGARGRGSDLPAAAAAARQVLERVAADVKRQAEEVCTERAAISAADALIAHDQAQCDAIIGELRLRLDKAASRCRRQGQKLLQAPSWSGHAPWTLARQRSLDAGLCAAANDEVEIALNAMISRLQEGADALLAACEQPAQYMDEDRYRAAIEEVSALCRQLVEEIELTLAEHLAQDFVGSRVKSILARSVRAMRIAIALAGGGTLASAAVAAQWGPGATILALLGTVTGTIASAVHALWERRQALQFVQKQTPPLHEALLGKVESAFRAVSSSSAAQLRGALAHLNAHCVRRDERVQPIRAEVENLEDAFCQIVARR